MARKNHPTLRPSEKAAGVVGRFAAELGKPDLSSEGFDAVLVATTTEEAAELAGPLARAIASSHASRHDNEAEEVAAPEEEVEEACVDLTLAERRKVKSAEARARRGKRDVKFAALPLEEL